MNDTSNAATFGRTSVLEQELAANLGRAYAVPQHVLDDAQLTIEQKRTILAGWASDAYAVENYPALRRLPGSERPVSIDEILEALRSLDRQVGEFVISEPRRRVRRAALEAFRAARAQSRRQLGGYVEAFAI